MLDYWIRDGNKHRMRYDDDYLEYGMTFLARNSNRAYRELQKVMILPDISYMNKLIAQRVTRSGKRAFSLCTITMNTVMKRSENEEWDENGNLLWLTCDSMSVKVGVQWDYRRSILVGQCNEFTFSPLKNRFHKEANNLKSLDSDGGNVHERVSIVYRSALTFV